MFSLFIDCTNGETKIIPYDSYYNDLIGYVEVCVNGTWGIICRDFFDDADAKVVCRSLGHSALGNTCMHIFHSIRELAKLLGLLHITC